MMQWETVIGLEVHVQLDTESTKTVGLTEAIIAERDRPRCDVFWNNEILNTLRLQKRGLLAVYRPAAAAAAGKVQRPVVLVLWIRRKAAGPFVERLLAVVAAATLLDDMALDDCHVVFLA